MDQHPVGKEESLFGLSDRLAISNVAFSRQAVETTRRLLWHRTKNGLGCRHKPLPAIQAQLRQAELFLTASPSLTLPA